MKYIKPAISYSYRKIQGIYEIGYYTNTGFRVVQTTTDWDYVLEFMSKNCS